MRLVNVNSNCGGNGHHSPQRQHPDAISGGEDEELEPLFCMVRDRTGVLTEEGLQHEVPPREAMETSGCPESMYSTPTS